MSLLLQPLWLAAPLLPADASDCALFVANFQCKDERGFCPAPSRIFRQHEEEEAPLPFPAEMPGPGLRRRGGAVTIAAVLVASSLCEQCSGCPPATSPLDIFLLGTGHCADAQKQTATAWGCTTDPCPTLSDEAACTMLCLADTSCTGFELRDLSTKKEVEEEDGAIVGAAASGGGSGSQHIKSQSTTAAAVATTPAPPAANLGCFLIVDQPTGAVAVWPWTRSNGTQAGPANRSVVMADGSADSCCYKKAYPRPNPSNNPVPQPPRQSALQQKIFAAQQETAAAASDAAIVPLTELLQYCLVRACVPCTCRVCQRERTREGGGGCGWVGGAGVCVACGVMRWCVGVAQPPPPPTGVGCDHIQHRIKKATPE